MCAGFLKKRRGMTLIEIMIVLAITGILLMIAIPGWLRQREFTRAIACQENLTKIEHAKEQYIFEHNLNAGAVIQLEYLYEGDNTGYLKKEPFCPAGGIYEPNPVNTDPTCSFYGMELFETQRHRLPNVND